VHGDGLHGVGTERAGTLDHDLKLVLTMKVRGQLGMWALLDQEHGGRQVRILARLQPFALEIFEAVFQLQPAPPALPMLRRSRDYHAYLYSQTGLKLYRYVNTWRISKYPISRKTTVEFAAEALSKQPSGDKP